MSANICIITPVKNRYQYMQGCIDSVAAQIYPDFYHLIVDGKSVDGTLEIIQSAAKGSDRIEFISEVDGSPGEAWNKALKLTQGEIIGWLGADDRYVDRRVFHHVCAFFDQHPDAFVAYGGCRFITEDGEVYGKSEEYHFDYNRLLNHDNYIPATSLFFKREVIDEVGFLDEYGNDLDYVLRIAQKYKIYPINRVLSDFVLASDSETGNLNRYVDILKLDWLVSKKHNGRYFNNYHRRHLVFSIIRSLGLLGIAKKIKVYREKGKVRRRYK